MVKKLDFKNFVQRPCTNVTVRRGYKWANLLLGEIIDLTDNGIFVETAYVKQLVIKKFRDIKLEDIRREHDPKCTTRNGLMKAMLLAYPDFIKDDTVVIVTYIRGK